MSFIDGLEDKLKLKTDDDYIPQDYEFSDGEGPEEGDFMIEGADNEENSDQEGFEEFSDD